MQKVEAQHNHAQNQPVATQRKGVGLESQQGERIAQLEAMMVSSPQAERQGDMAAMMNASPAMAAQRKMSGMIHNSAGQAAQRRKFDSLSGSRPIQRQSASEPQPETAQREVASTEPANSNLPNAVVQREVIFDNKTGKFYSDLDPSQEFDTQLEAQQFELDMEAPPPISGGRAPTLYTYMSTPSHRKMSSLGIPQGPHTMGYAALTQALFSAQIEMKSLIAEQVPDPQSWRDLVIRESGDHSLFEGDTEESLRMLRAYQAYNGLWQELRRILNDEGNDDPLDLIHELLQMHPFAVYGWTDPSKVTKKHLKGKGENRDLSDPKNIDVYAKFSAQQEYITMIEDRMDLLDDDYIDDSQGEYSSDDEEHSDMEEE